MKPTKSSLDAISKEAGLEFATGNIGDIVSAILPWIFAIAGTLLLLYLLFGGFVLMTSTGDPKKIEQGKKIITNALIGFVIVFVAYWIVQAVGLILGLQNIGLIFNPFSNPGPRGR